MSMSYLVDVEDFWVTYAHGKAYQLEPLLINQVPKDK